MSAGGHNTDCTKGGTTQDICNYTSTLANLLGVISPGQRWLVCLPIKRNDDKNDKDKGFGRSTSYMHTPEDGGKLCFPDFP